MSEIKSYIIDFDKIVSFNDVLLLTSLLKFDLELDAKDLNETFLELKNHLETIYKNVIIKNVSNDSYLKYLKEIK